MAGRDAARRGWAAALARAVAVAWLALVLPTAPAQAQAQAQEATALPFVDEHGLLQPELSWQDVVQAIGAPERSESPRSTYRNRRPNVTHLYPGLGLSFGVKGRHADRPDAPVQRMAAKAPMQGRTPQGLQVGMPQAQALALLERHYRLQPPPAAAGSQDMPFTAHDRGGSSRKVLVWFHDGRVQQLAFLAQERPWPLDAALGALALLIAPSLAGLLFGAWILARAWLRCLAVPDLQRAVLPPGRSDQSDARDAVGWLLVAVGLACAWAAQRIAAPGGALAWVALPAAALGLLALLAGVARLVRTRNRLGTGLGAVCVLSLVLLNVLSHFGQYMP